MKTEEAVKTYLAVGLEIDQLAEQIRDLNKVREQEKKAIHARLLQMIEDLLGKSRGFEFNTPYSDGKLGFKPLRADADGAIFIENIDEADFIRISSVHYLVGVKTGQEYLYFDVSSGAWDRDWCTNVTLRIKLDHFQDEKAWNEYIQSLRLAEKNAKAAEENAKAEKEKLRRQKEYERLKAEFGDG